MFLIKCIVFSILTFLSFPAIGAEAFTEGLRYQKLVTPLQQTVHVLVVDPNTLTITAAHAKEKVIGRETVATIARNHNALAAINGGFFKSGEKTEGLPAGILKIQGRWYGIAYNARGAIGWSDPLHTVFIDRIQTKTSLHLNHKKFPIHSVNQPGTPKKAILYTNAYGTFAGSIQGGYDIAIQDNRILSVHPSGKTPIPKEGFVYSIGSGTFHTHPPVSTGMPAIVNIEAIPQLLNEHQLAWQSVDNIVGGAPVLVFQGKIIHDHHKERIHPSFVTERFARSAVGTLKNGHWVFVVVEKNALMNSPGMTIPELAVFMHNLGCQYALNLDGGHSSTLYIDNEVVSHPEGEDNDDYGMETIRPVSDAILILKKQHHQQ